MGKSNLQRFGGSWTDAKLSVLSAYLLAYTTALKKQSFRKLYIDGFAGTGYRELKTPADSAPVFQELAEPDPQKFLDGSARIALQTDPSFDEFIFIEAVSQRARELRDLQQDFPGKKINVKEGEANDEIQRLCSATNWRTSRAVLFLDPYGMQVDWTTMEAIAKTEAIDTWILFPLGVGVNRLLMQDLSNIPDTWKNRLDRMFGTSEWKTQFYRKRPGSENLFEQPQEGPDLKEATFASIGTFYHERLKLIFKSVAPNPKDLRNSTGNPLFQLHFAAGSPRGGPIALKIAKHILDNV